MIEDFRLPDPPPALRERILAGARATPRSGRRFVPFAGLAAAAVLLGGVLWVVLTAPAARHGRPAQAPPADELRYSVTTENGNLYTLKVSRLSGGGQTAEKVSIGSVSGKWGMLTTGESSKKFVVPDLSGDDEADPKLEERTILESGYLLCFRARPGKDGLIDADVRFFVVEKRALSSSVVERVSLKPGEERVLKLSK